MTPEEEQKWDRMDRLTEREEYIDELKAEIERLAKDNNSLIYQLGERKNRIAGLEAILEITGKDNFNLLEIINTQGARIAELDAESAARPEPPGDREALAKRAERVWLDSLGNRSRESAWLAVADVLRPQVEPGAIAIKGATHGNKE